MALSPRPPLGSPTLLSKARSRWDKQVACLCGTDESGHFTRLFCFFFPAGMHCWRGKDWDFCEWDAVQYRYRYDSRNTLFSYLTLLAALPTALSRWTFEKGKDKQPARANCPATAKCCLIIARVRIQSDFLVRRLRALLLPAVKTIRLLNGPNCCWIVEIIHRCV